MSRVQDAPQIAFRLDKPFVLLNPLLRMHWAARSRHNRALGGLVRLATHGQRPAQPFARALVRIERRSLRAPDHDGLVGGAKGLIDCLLPQGKPYVVTKAGRSRWVLPHPTGLGIILDDAPECLVLRVQSGIVLKRAEQCTLVEISCLSEATPDNSGLWLGAALDTDWGHHAGHNSSIGQAGRHRAEGVQGDAARLAPAGPQRPRPALGQDRAEGVL